MDNRSLVMIRKDLAHLPTYELPAGFSFRWYRPGDEAGWVRVQSQAEKYLQISLDLYRREFGTDPGPLSERQIFIADSGSSVIGTATAWFGDERHGPSFGRVHWVAIAPEFQGRGLANPLLAAVCERLRALGHEGAVLGTSSARIPALNLYLKFGFRPEIQGEEDREAWAALKPSVHYPLP